MKNNVRSRKFRGGAYATAISFLVILVLIVVNLVSGSLFKRYDVTSTGKYSLAEDTKEFIKGVTTPIDLYYVTAEGEEDLIIKTGAEQIADASDLITLTVKDPIQYPQFVYRYNKMADITNNSIIVVNADNPERYVYIDSEQMKTYLFNSSTLAYQQTGYDAEVEIVKAIVEVTREKKGTIYVTTNHSEYITTRHVEQEKAGQVSDTFADLMKLNAYKIKYCNLMTLKEVPEDCDILIIGTPRSDFSETEVEAVKNYMTAGGTVVLSMQYDSNVFMNLKSLLAYYGISYTAGVVCDEDSSRTVGDTLYYLLADYDGGTTEWPDVVPMYVEDNVRLSTKVTKLITTSKNGYVKASDDENGFVRTSNDEAGEYPLLLKVEDTFEGKTGTMYVFGATYFMADELLTGGSSMANRKLLVDILNGQAGDTEEVLSIPDTTALEEALQMTTGQRNRIALASFLLPVLILFGGVVVVLMRRVEKVASADYADKGEE